MTKLPMTVERTGKTDWKVGSECTRDKYYYVAIYGEPSEKKWVCTCPAFANYDAPCKHLKRVISELESENAPKQPKALLSDREVTTAIYDLMEQLKDLRSVVDREIGQIRRDITFVDSRTQDMQTLIERVEDLEGLVNRHEPDISDLQGRMDDIESEVG